MILMCDAGHNCDYRRLRTFGTPAAELFSMTRSGSAGGRAGETAVLETSGTFQSNTGPRPKMTLYFYYGYVSGRKVIQSIYPAGSAASLTYWEISHRF